MTNDQLDEVNLQLEKQKQELAHAEKISEVCLCLSLFLSVSLSLGGRCCCRQDVDSRKGVKERRQVLKRFEAVWAIHSYTLEAVWAIGIVCVVVISHCRDSVATVVYLV